MQSDMTMNTTMNTTMTMSNAALPKIDAQQFAVMLKRHHEYVNGAGGEQLNLSDAEFVAESASIIVGA